MRKSGKENRSKGDAESEIAHTMIELPAEFFEMLDRGLIQQCFHCVTVQYIADSLGFGALSLAGVAGAHRQHKSRHATPSRVEKSKVKFWHLPKLSTFRCVFFPLLPPTNKKIAGDGRLCSAL